MFNDPTGETAGQESIFGASLAPGPIGYDGWSRPGGQGDADPPDNTLIYGLSLLSLLCAPFFGPVAIGVGIYRIRRHRPHAVRGLVVAAIATLVGLAPVVTAVVGGQ